MPQASTDGKGFAYATVTINLPGRAVQANIANYFYPPERNDYADPMRALQDDLTRRLAFARGEPQPPMMPRLVGTPVEVFDRLRKALWTPEDVTTIITLGLVGAGNSLETATDIVDQHVRSHPIAAALPSALAVLGMFLVGADGGDTA